MPCVVKTVFKSLSIANGCLFSLPSIFSTKTSYPFLSTPSQPINLNLSCSHSSSSVSFFSLHTRTHSSTTVAAAADWAQQGPNTAVVEDEEVGLDAVGDAGQSSGEEMYPEPSEGAKLYVGNLEYDVDSETLAQLFEKAGVVEVAEIIYNRETEKSRGFGFVTMSTVEEAEQAIEMFNRYDLNGKLLTVNKASPRGSLPRLPRPENNIYVGNLPWDVDNQGLVGLFSDYGRVMDAKILYHREKSRSRGFGFVAMSTEAEMNDAVSNLDGKSVGGRTIKVSVAVQKPEGSF